MDKKEIIIINGFPNNGRKIKILEEQITYLKQLNLPILMVSGCDVPPHISNLLDYVIINKENEVLGKDYQYYLQSKEVGNEDKGDYMWTSLANHWVKLFTPNVNCTITKNIKLAFTTAKHLGYTSAFYTVDDNVFRGESLDWIRTNLNRLSEYELVSVNVDMDQVDYFMLFSTFFFTNLDFFISKFNVPSSAKDWWDIDNINKYSLSKVYEGIFADAFKDDLSKIFTPRDEFDQLIEKQLVGWNLVTRYQNENYLIDTTFTIVPDAEGTKYLVLYNFSRYLIEGQKTYTIDVYYDNEYIGSPYLAVAEAYTYMPVPEHVQEVRLNIHGYGEKIIKTSREDIKYNGLAIPV